MILWHTEISQFLKYLKIKQSSSHKKLTKELFMKIKNCDFKAELENCSQKKNQNLKTSKPQPNFNNRSDSESDIKLTYSHLIIGAPEVLSLLWPLHMIYILSTVEIDIDIELTKAKIKLIRNKIASEKKEKKEKQEKKRKKYFAFLKCAIYNWKKINAFLNLNLNWT